MAWMKHPCKTNFDTQGNEYLDVPSDKLKFIVSLSN